MSAQRQVWAAGALTPWRAIELTGPSENLPTVVNRPAGSVGFLVVFEDEAAAREWAKGNDPVPVLWTPPEAGR